MSRKKRIPLARYILGKALLVGYSPRNKYDAENKRFTDEPDGTFEYTVADAGNKLETISVRCEEALPEAMVKQIKEAMERGQFFEVNFDAEATVTGHARGNDVEYYGNAKKAHVLIGQLGGDGK